MFINTDVIFYHNNSLLKEFNIRLKKITNFIYLYSMEPKQKVILEVVSIFESQIYKIIKKESLLINTYLTKNQLN